ncbi:MAG: NADH-quinone oxidoreductase subunit M [Anaerolineae bacterium]|nr:NADH-quinone oxidoreductase subunit M [Anaerolineae bacterium]MCO5188977.1 NADH-quinone oxidoreductase subunit M [Anaerolineae bacterium]MCO5194816.1 NADH-quinone oxidoreductase subunit M [Anaerolineae bacterium]MCO5197615.1 NADH-quinone oxidoreductase subunit M [Anaerolineae bacterium]MCO5203763.1 NADH-quinone oxidoreductase subunit M [Anaerolineae bacterium]
MSEFNGILTVLTFFPAVGIVLLLLFNRGGGESAERNIRWIALVTTIFTFVISLIVMITFDKNRAGLQMIDRAQWIPQLGISYFLGIDGISIWMIFLTTFIMMLAVGASFPLIEQQTKQYYVFMLLLEIGMLGVFLAQDLFLFYVFWEVTLVPMYFLIGIWGSKRRVYAALKFFLYTMAGSLLMLIAILYLGVSNETFALPALIAGRDTFAGAQNILFLAFAIAFAIKVPIFPFHSWLPDAHTEAPTAGSIILAGVLLKMGTYGFMRFNLPLFPDASAYFAPAIAILAIIGIIYGAAVAFAQTDVKRLVAYSSVSHLGFVMLGIFALNEAGLEGAILQGVNHGLSSGALFFIVGVIYAQRHTRDIAAYGGVWKVMPVFSVLTLIITLSSMGLPGLNGFVGEFTILLGSMDGAAYGPTPWIYTAFATVGVILAAVYLLWMFQRVFMGPVDNPENKKLRDINKGELAIMLSFLLFIVWIGIAPSGYFDFMTASVSQLVESVSAGAMVALP